MPDIRIQNAPFNDQSTAPPSFLAPKLPPELLEKVIDHLDSGSLLNNLRVSKQWQALSMRSGRLSRHILGQGYFNMVSKDPAVLLPQLTLIVRTQYNLRRNSVTRLTEQPSASSHRMLVEVAGRTYRVRNTAEERRAMGEAYPLHQMVDMQPRPRRAEGDAASGEVPLRKITTPYVLKRCGHEGGYLPAPFFSTLPKDACTVYARDLRFFAATSDGRTLFTQRGDDVATRVSHPIRGRLRLLSYVHAHLLLVTTSEVRVLDAQDNHNVIFVVARPMVHDAKLSRDGKLLVIETDQGGRDRLLQCFDTTNGNLLTQYVFEAPQNSNFLSRCCSLDPSGQYLAIPSSSNTLIFLNVKMSQAETITTESGRSAKFASVCFSPLKDILAVGTARGDILIYKKNLDRLELLTHLLEGDTTLQGSPILSLSFDSVGSTVHAVDHAGGFRSIDLRGAPAELAGWKSTLAKVSKHVLFPAWKAYNWCLKKQANLSAAMSRIAARACSFICHWFERIADPAAWNLRISGILASISRLFDDHRP